MNTSTWSELGITLRRPHGEQHVRCPSPACADKRSPSLSANPDKGVFVCHRCGWSGRVGSASDWLGDQLERIQKADRERDKARDTAASNARALWHSAGRAMWHEYLKRKAVLPLGIRQRDRLLVIPMFDSDGRLWNCQTIDQAGDKRFLRGGRTQGLYYPIRGDSHAIYVCEGFATGAALHLYFEKHAQVAVAFNCGNLIHVAKALREKYPGTPLAIAADNDQWTAGNPGLTHARQAAAAVGAKVIYPKFNGLDVGGRPTDFCDLHLLQREAVRVG